MKKVFAIALVPLLCTGAAQAEVAARGADAAGVTAPAVVRAAEARRAADAAQVPAVTWGAEVDYDHTIDRPDMLSSVARNEEIARPAFATLRRSFGQGEFRPYIGVGVGQASAKFDAVAPGTPDSYAVKGVLGGNLIFSKEIGGYVQYDYAIASENPALADDGKSHGISFGLKISLN